MRRSGFALRFAALVCSLAALAVLAAPACAADLAHQRAVSLEQLYWHEGPSVNLSTVYKSLPPEQRQALMAKVKEMVLAHLPPDILQHPTVGGLPPEAQAMLKQALLLVQATTPAQLDAVVQQLDLDHLAPIPPAAFRLYHERALGQKVPETTLTRAAILAADRGTVDAWRAGALQTPGYVNTADPVMERLDLLEPGEAAPPEELPADEVEPASIQGLVKATRIVELPAHVLVNSKRLARAFCHLSNPSYQATPMVVRVAGAEHRVKSGPELVNVLLGTGRYDVAVFDARMFVDFCGYSILRGEEPLPIKIPTWSATDIAPADPENQAPAAGERRLIVPINHSEHVLAFFAKGSLEPQLLVRWYMGLPGGQDLKQGTIFKPAIYQRCSWSGWRVVRIYREADAARMLVQGGGFLMQALNFIQGRHRLPFNGYAELAVCQDTTALMEAMLKGRTGDCTIWPTARDPRLDVYYEPFVARLRLSLSTEADGLRYLNVPSDARPDLYPWAQERRVLLWRLGANIPTRDLAALHFPELKEDLESMKERSDVVRRSLELFE